MQVNMVISDPAIKLNVNIAIYLLKLQTMYKPWSFHVCVLGLLFANTASFKIIIKHKINDVRFLSSSSADSSHELGMRL